MASGITSDQLTYLTIAVVVLIGVVFLWAYSKYQATPKSKRRKK